MVGSGPEVEPHMIRTFSGSNHAFIKYEVGPRYSTHIRQSLLMQRLTIVGTQLEKKVGITNKSLLMNLTA